MKLESKLFDRIRIKPRHEEKPRVVPTPCAWEGCDQPGEFRAPKGNRAEGQYHVFCLEHVRHYNSTFNFFAGMSPGEMEDHLKRSAETDGRPSWGFGAKPGTQGPRMPRADGRDPGARRVSDPLHIFARYARAQARGPQKEHVKPLHEPDRRALETLGLHGHAPAAEIKKAYKGLVKLHHPDANGGDKTSEERLRAIIAAYAHLKTRGFVGR
ncbi:J domain-containing protein [Devosia sp.]|uniref:J domain-containing protein n=1 Tax=Devosia sp. TaxID=1871048 RepID=UPI002EEF036C